MKGGKQTYCSTDLESVMQGEKVLEICVQQRAQLTVESGIPKNCKDSTFMLCGFLIPTSPNSHNWKNKVFLGGPIKIVAHTIM